MTQGKSFQRIKPCLWITGEAEEAVALYTGLFPDSKTGAIARHGKSTSAASGMPEGSVLTIEFTLAGQEFLALNGGPHFQFTPAVSLSVSCASEAEIDTLWAKLSDGGQVLMPLGEYPFSPKYGWLKDRFGLSWQINLLARDQKIAPTLMFTEQMSGNADEAMKLYTGLFANSKIGEVARYGPEGPGPEGTVAHATFTLAGQTFMAMDAPGEHAFGFTGAVSFIINCEAQSEIDRFWEALTEGGQVQGCGWVEDRFGVVWQVVPANLGQMVAGDPECAERVMAAIMPMQKLDLATLEKAYAG
jgi:predicted 3-demethylubiquinone-9 3-methyltransferase (glyoxalase superfamily)